MQHASKENMMIRSVRSSSFSLRAICLALALAALFTNLGWADGKKGETRIRTQLSGGTLNGQVPSGHADFRSEASQNKSRLNVEVENVNLPDGTVLSIFLTHSGSESKIGEITLTAGFGEFELASQDSDVVPSAAKGDMVTVKAAMSIVAGVF
jgi:hypothetical protein